MKAARATVRRALALLAPCAAACGGPSLQGATAVAAGTEPPPAAPERVLDPKGCQDAAGAPTSVASRFWLVESSDRRELLVAARPGFDSIVVSARFDLPAAQVYQFFSDDGDGPRLLHELRFPRAAGAPAVLTISDQFRERTLDDRPFAEPQGVLVRCTLAAVAAEAR